MKPEELRIGNLVSKKPHKVWIPFKITYQDIGNIYESTLINKVPSGIYKPIPITEELLLKAGFEEVKSRDGVARAYKLKNLRLNMSNSGNFYHNNLSIFYVHQLQNLYFALTGIELKCT